MKTQSADTSPEAERAQIALLREASPAKRLALASALTGMTIQLARRGLRRAHPAADERALRVLALAHAYGSGLSERLRPRLERSRPGGRRARPLRRHGASDRRLRQTRRLLLRRWIGR